MQRTVYIMMLSSSISLSPHRMNRRHLMVTQRIFCWISPRQNTQYDGKRRQIQYIRTILKVIRSKTLDIQYKTVDIRYKYRCYNSMTDVYHLVIYSYTRWFKKKGENLQHPLRGSHMVDLSKNRYFYAQQPRTETTKTSEHLK